MSGATTKLSTKPGFTDWSESKTLERAGNCLFAAVASLGSERMATALKVVPSFLLDNPRCFAGLQFPQINIQEQYNVSTQKGSNYTPAYNKDVDTFLRIAPIYAPFPLMHAIFGANILEPRFQDEEAYYAGTEAAPSLYSILYSLEQAHAHACQGRYGAAIPLDAVAISCHQGPFHWMRQFCRAGYICWLIVRHVAQVSEFEAFPPHSPSQKFFHSPCVLVCVCYQRDLTTQESKTVATQYAHVQVSKVCMEIC